MGEWIVRDGGCWILCGLSWMIDRSWWLIVAPLCCFHDACCYNPRHSHQHQSFVPLPSKFVLLFLPYSCHSQILYQLLQFQLHGLFQNLTTLLTSIVTEMHSYFNIHSTHPSTLLILLLVLHIHTLLNILPSDIKCYPFADTNDYLNVRCFILFFFYLLFTQISHTQITR